MTVLQNQLGRGTKAAVSLQYRRREGQVRTKKLHKKTKLRSRHIVLSFMGIAGFFLILQQVCLFALTWDKLDINNIYVTCANPEIKSRVENRIQNYSFGNILLFDAAKLKAKLESFPRVKSAAVKIIFPLSLRITVTERTPFALINSDVLSVIDAEGVVIGQDASDTTSLPLLFDTDNFRENYPEKIELARSCLEDLRPQQRALIAYLDVSENLNIKIKTRDSSSWLILGNTKFAENFDRYLTEKTYLEGYGQLEYIDLRFQDRFILKSQKDSSRVKSAMTAKEVN